MSFLFLSFLSLNFLSVVNFIIHDYHNNSSGLGLASFAVPLVVGLLVAILAYIASDRLGEWKKRRMYSKLGIAVIEELQEEIETGIVIMSTSLKRSKENGEAGGPQNPLPRATWSGINTISDEILLRIIEASKDQEFQGPYKLNHRRSHCKNYFENITSNFANQKVMPIGLWQKFLQDCITAANDVNLLLDQAKALLERNSNARIPK